MMELRKRIVDAIFGELGGPIKWTNAEAAADAVMAVLREQEPSAWTEVLDEIGSLIGVGRAARTMGVIRANIENMKRRSDCLRAVEWEFFTVKKAYEEGDCEPGDEGAEYDECLLNWGSDPAEYVEQFRAALAGLKSVPSSVPDVHLDEAVRKSWSRFSNAVGCGEDAPYPGMIDAFERHFSQPFSDRAWRVESGTWAAAWKAAKRHTEESHPADSAVPEGWQLVPMEPTPEMLDAACRADESRAISPADRYRAMLSAAPKPELTAAVRDVLAERRRQVESEGWTSEHDDEHSGGEMARAGAAYAAQSLAADDAELVCGPPSWWPWDRECWKPSSRRRMLVKAAALILAEIERIDRAASKLEGEHG